MIANTSGVPFDDGYHRLPGEYQASAKFDRMNDNTAFVSFAASSVLMSVTFQRILRN